MWAHTPICVWSGGLFFNIYFLFHSVYAHHIKHYICFLNANVQFERVFFHLSLSFAPKKTCFYLFIYYFCYGIKTVSLRRYMCTCTIQLNLPMCMDFFRWYVTICLIFFFILCVLFTFICLCVVLQTTVFVYKRKYMCIVYIIFTFAFRFLFDF